MVLVYLWCNIGRGRCDRECLDRSRRRTSRWHADSPYRHSSRMGKNPGLLPWSEQVTKGRFCLMSGSYEGEVLEEIDRQVRVEYKRQNEE